MKFFTKEELKKIGLILVILLGISFINFRGSLTKARDAQRKADTTFIKEKLEEYQSEVGYFPPAGADGRILACKGNSTVINLEFKRLENPTACKWGEDSLINYFSATPKTILEKLPIDPQSGGDAKYIYKASASRFQIYASLEATGDAEFNKKIEALKIKCGTKLCNFGRSFGDTPLDKTIQQYENELLNK